MHGKGKPACFGWGFKRAVTASVVAAALFVLCRKCRVFLALFFFFCGGGFFFLGGVKVGVCLKKKPTGNLYGLTTGADLRQREER